MATFTANPSGDGYVQRSETYSGRGAATWEEVAANSTGTLVNTSAAYIYVTGTKRTSNTNWILNRGLLYFDLSSMPADANIVSAHISFYVNTYIVNDPRGYWMRGYLWTGSTGSGLDDYNDWDENYITSEEKEIDSTGAHDFTIDNTLLGWLQDNPQGDASNNFPIMIRNKYDYDATLLADPTDINAVLFRSQNYASSGDRPVLNIIYNQLSAVNGVAKASIAAVNGVTKEDGTKVNSY